MDARWQCCLDSYLQTIEDRSGSLASRETYDSTLRRFFTDPLKSPSDYTRSEVISFVQQPSTSRRNFGQPASASCKNQRLCVIQGFYRYASAYEIDGTPLYQKSLPTQGIPYMKRDIHPQVMTADELERLIAIIPDTPKGLRDKALYLLYFWLGRRRSELYRLRWRDIQATIIVDEDGTRRAGYVYTYTSKGKSRQPTTKELPAPAWHILHTYLERSGRLATIKPDDYLFVSISPGIGRKGSVRGSIDGGHLNHDYLNMEFVKYARLAHLRPGLTLHSLRHAAARERYLAGSKIRDIQHFLDHSSIATTDIYLRTIAGVSDPGAALLEKRFGHLGF